MRIVILVHNLTNGGAERVASLWAQGFSQRGHSVVMVLYDKNSPLTYKIPSSVTIHNIAPSYHFVGFVIPILIYRLRRVLKAEKPDVIIDVLPAWWKLFSTMGLKSTVIATEHNSFERPETAPFTIFEKIHKFYLNKIYNKVTVLTQVDKKTIGNRMSNVYVLPNPLAITPISEKQFDLKSKKNIILAVGRVEAWFVKGFDVLIKAWAEVSNERKDWKLIILGGKEGAGRSYLEKLCKDLSVKESVDFIDFQSRIEKYYQQASIYVLSSRYEGFGMVLLEAMSQGCACIVCDNKGRQREILKNSGNALICEPDNVKELAKSIITMINNEQIRSDYQKNAIKCAHYYSLDHIMDMWDEIIIS